MEDVIYEELFKIPYEKFTRHIESNTNRRILFSGKFGKGKTTFLKHFFETNQSKYFPIHISPVNYSVASNEDIFKYIKYDLILELLRQGIQFEESDFSFMDSLPMFIKKHPDKIVGRLLAFIPAVGKQLEDYYEKGKELYEEMKKHTDELNKKGEANQLEAYLEKHESVEGGIYENDFVTQILEKSIDKIKASGRETVLIIDDLDRLDPEHIFRILNVFATQFNSYSSTDKDNKFGLNKIIVVCDLDNVRNIYKNRYGADVDFVGYINKFYSSEPFLFNNYKELVEISYQILGQIKIGDNREYVSLRNYLANNSGYNRTEIGIYQVIANLLFFDFLSLKTLLSYSKGRVFNMLGTYQIGEAYFENERSAVIIEAQILNGLLGGFENAKYVLERLSTISSKINSHEYYYRQILYFLLYPNQGYSPDSSGMVYDSFEGRDFRFKISGRKIEVLDVAERGNWFAFNTTKNDYFKLLRSLFIKLYENGAIE